MARPALECVGGPFCGEWLQLPEEGDAVVVPMGRLARVLIRLGRVGRRRGVYRAGWSKSGDPVFLWLGEG